MLEMLAVTLLLEIVREAGLRAPQSISHTVSIVGALIIGETAVNAGIVSVPVALPWRRQPPLPRWLCLLCTSKAFCFASRHPAGRAVWRAGADLRRTDDLSNGLRQRAIRYDYLYPLMPPGKASVRDGFVRSIWSDLAKAGEVIGRHECEHPSLYAALLVGVLVNVLLRSQTAYRPRAGGGQHRFARRCWRQSAHCLPSAGGGATPLLRLLLALLLAGTSVLELLRLWNLTSGYIPVPSPSWYSACWRCCHSLPAPRLWQFRRRPTWCFACWLHATAVMLFSVFPRLQITNLQYAVLTRSDFADAARDQLTLYPEYLLPALWPEPQSAAATRCCGWPVSPFGI